MAEYMEEQNQDPNDYADYDFDDDDYDDDEGYVDCEDDMDGCSGNPNTPPINDRIQYSPPAVAPPVKPAKILLPDLVRFVLFYIPFARLDGKLCYYNERTHCYMGVKSKEDVEAVIYRKYPRILSVVNTKMLSDCARVIYKLEEFPDQEPSEAEGFLGFSDGIYVYNRNTGAGCNFFSFDFLDWSLKHPHEPFPQSTSWKTKDAQECPEIFSPEWWEKYNKGVEEINKIPQWNRSFAGGLVLEIPALKKYSTLPIKITHTLNASFKSCVPITINIAQYVEPQKEIDKWMASEAPNTIAFFRSISGDDMDLLCRIWEVLACILVPDPTVKNFFLLSGVPDSGKSVLGNFIKSFFAKEQVSSLDFTRLGDRYSSSALPGTYLNMSMDLPNRVISLKTIAMLKMLTGDDDVTVEAKFANVASYRNRCRFLFASNHDLRLAEHDQAFLNRLVVVPFNHKVPAEQQDRNLLPKLLAERDAVAAFVIQLVYPALKRKNFVFSGTGRDKFQPNIIYSKQYRNIQEYQIEKFIDAYCVITGSDNDKVYTEDLYDRYTDFCIRDSLEKACDIRFFSQVFYRILAPKIMKHKIHTSSIVDGHKVEKNQNGFKGVILRVDPMTDDD